jgi:hypothetical protein
MSVTSPTERPGRRPAPRRRLAGIAVGLLVAVGSMVTTTDDPARTTQKLRTTDAEATGDDSDARTRTSDERSVPPAGIGGTGASDDATDPLADLGTTPAGPGSIGTVGATGRETPPRLDRVAEPAPPGATEPAPPGATPGTPTPGTPTPPGTPRLPGTPGSPSTPRTPDTPGRPTAPDPPGDPKRPDDDDPDDGPPDGPGPVDDVEACRNLGRAAIGDTSWGDGVDGHTEQRFRAIAQEVQASHPLLVCANPIVAWRDDLYVERLFAGGESVGMLVSGREPGDPVIAATLNEWAGWGWRSDHNFVGVPTERLVIDGVRIIRTHRGGVVVEHLDSMAIPVVNGAWHAWMLAGGPRGSMGMPVGRAAADPAGGARQDFTLGRLRLPDITMEFEAEVQPVERFIWTPWTELAPPAGPRPPANSVIEIAGAAYYVGTDGRRHWIPTTTAWFCADDSDALMLGEVDGRVMASFPLGEAYTCDT